MADIRSVLEKYWGYKEFRSLQEEIITSVLNKHDTLALLPTGAGKSICYQVPALMQEGLCLVISPLIALMQDQVEQLKKRDIKAGLISSGMHPHEVESVFNHAAYGDLKFLYVSPERLKTDLFLAKLPNLRIAIIAVDEAHCISQWGYDFRPSYLKISEIKQVLQGVPIIALTATATEQVLKDIELGLELKNPRIFKASFKRENISILIRKEEKKEEAILNILNHVQGSSIIYVRNRRRTEDISRFLLDKKISADFYHAGLEYEKREQKLKDWISGKIRCMVCTNAFGMGIDKPNVRSVIHLDLPDSIEAWYQEIGRAGRDGFASFAVTLFHQKDVEFLHSQINLSFPDLETIRNVYRSICNYYQIALHAGEGLGVDLHLDQISSSYKIPQVILYNAIKLLEKEGVFAFQELSYQPSRLKFSMHKDELYNFQVSYQQHESLIKALLRSYGGIMDNFVPISEFQLASQLKLPEKEIGNRLKKLQEFGVLEYFPKSSLPKLTFCTPRIDHRFIVLSKENYSEQKERMTQRINAMINLMSQTNMCRSRIILQYFGEKDFEDCGNCDICREKKKKEAGVLHQHIEQEILNLLVNRKLSIAEITSLLYRYAKEDVIETINELVDTGKIIQNDSRIFYINNKI